VIEVSYSVYELLGGANDSNSNTKCDEIWTPRSV